MAMRAQQTHGLTLACSSPNNSTHKTLVAIWDVCPHFIFISGFEMSISIPKQI
jgi:hypothetical protein